MDACVFVADGWVEVGDEVVLIGEQNDRRVTAEELGLRAGTINYEVTTGVNPRRVERSYGDVRGS
jgi:alanine racemase